MVVSEQDLKEDLATFGGERRLSQFLPIKQTVVETAQQKQVDKINQTRGFCLTFITPCVFAQGYLPEWIDQKSMTGKLPDSEIKVRLKDVDNYDDRESQRHHLKNDEKFRTLTIIRNAVVHGKQEEKKKIKQILEDEQKLKQSLQERFKNLLED